MREILFKAKRIDNGEWHEGFYWNDYPIVVEGYKRGREWKHYIKDSDSGSDEDFQVDSSTVCQYTGLKDKNGVKIFEGDELKTKYGSIFSDKDMFEYHLWAYRNSMSFTTVEVIGNLHDK